MRHRRAGLVLISLLVTGCYTLRPVTGPPPAVGNRVAFDVTDSGRAVLGSLLGPGVGRIQGRLLDRDTGTYVLSVTSVRLLRGGEQVWRGEVVRLDRRLLGTMYERRFSASRTVALGAVGVGGLLAVIFSIDLLAGGSEDQDQTCDPETEPCQPDERVGRPWFRAIP